MGKSKAQKIWEKQQQKQNNQKLRTNGFLNFISVADTPKSLQISSAKQYRLQATADTIIDSEEVLSHAISKASLPMDPPGGTLWDGLADSLFGGFNSSNYRYDNVDIFWLHADDSAASAPQFFIRL